MDKMATRAQAGRETITLLTAAALAVVSSLATNALADEVLYYEVGGDNSNFTLANLPAGVTAVKKIGTGTMTDNGALDGLSLLAAQGKVVLLPNAGRTGFRHYRFKIERNRGSGTTGLEFSELKLYNGVTDVTGLRSGVLFDGLEGANNGVNAYPAGQAPTNAVDGDTSTVYFDRRLKKTGSSWTDADREKLWLQISITNEKSVTSYDWARGNGDEGTARDPADWRFQGSVDGVHWLDLDVRTNFTTSKAVRTFVGPFECLHSYGDLTDRYLGSVAAEMGAEVEISNTTLEASGLRGDGVVTCTGGGAVRVMSGLAEQIGVQLGGNLRVLGGTWRVRSDAIADPYYRFTFKKVYAANNKFSLAEIALFDRDGERTGHGAYTIKRGIEPSALQPGEILCRTGDVFGGSGAEGPDKMFDGDLESGKCFYSKRNNSEDAYLDEEDPDKWFVLTMRLRDGFNPVCGYNFLSCNDNNNRNRSPIIWVVETSADGVIWTKRDEVDPYAGTPPSSNFTFWNNGEPWIFEDIPASELSLAAADVLVASNATLEVIGTNAVISRISVDVAAGGGTITTFTPAANGVLRIMNYPGGTSITGYELPLTFGSVDNASSLSKWKLFVNGVERNNRIALINGKIYVLESKGFCIDLR